jgi:hypothetical protein
MKRPASTSAAADLERRSLTSGLDATASVNVWERIPGALERWAPSFLLVASPGGGAPVKVEGCAIPVWEALATPGSVAAVVGAVADATGSDRLAIADDVEAALVALRDVGIVVCS